jgi:succinate dehydrogenase / fumarate reductase membrane anchor subunit
MAGSVERVRIILNYEGIAWKWMRYSGLLLIPLAWGQVLNQDVLVGVHQIDIDYLAMHWASWDGGFMISCCWLLHSRMA